MLSWFKVTQIGHVVGASVVMPTVPTYVWANTAFYARERAAIRFGVSAQSVVVKCASDPESFPSNAVELVESDTFGVEERPLRLKGEMRATPETNVERKLVRGVQRAISRDIDRVIVTKPPRKKKKRPVKTKKRGKR